MHCVLLNSRGSCYTDHLTRPILCCPNTAADTAANLATFSKGGGYHGGTGYPMVRVLALVACGTRTIIDAVFGTDRTGELGYAHQLLRSTRAGMIVLADRNFAAAAWLAALSATGAEVLVRVKNQRRLPVCRALPDGSFLSRIGGVEVRVITAQVTITTRDTRRTETYRLVTSVLDPSVPALDIVGLYHERWEIETAFAELKSTSLGGRVLRSHTPTGVAQEVYALLITYQALRIAISDTTLHRPDRPRPRCDGGLRRLDTVDRLGWSIATRGRGAARRRLRGGHPDLPGVGGRPAFGAGARPGRADAALHGGSATPGRLYSLTRRADPAVLQRDRPTTQLADRTRPSTDQPAGQLTLAATTPTPSPRQPLPNPTRSVITNYGWSTSQAGDFPTLVGLMERGDLDVPVIGAAKSGWGWSSSAHYAAAS